jgi:stearoyl-CoA desaturase (delta-9 desaturase)
LPAAVGAAITQTWLGALAGFLWGGLIRMFAVHNMIYWITSFAHVFGSHDLACNDRSTNSFWLALLTMGEGWHNNHHAFPRAAVLSFRWWQLDLSGAVILLLGRLGLASSINRPAADAIRARGVG